MTMGKRPTNLIISNNKREENPQKNKKRIKMDKKCNIHGNIKECLRVLNKEWKRDDNSICNKSTKDLQLETNVT